MTISKDQIKFLVFFGIIVILTPFLMDIISRSWNTELMKGIANGLRTIDPSAISFIISTVVGFYIGSFILLFKDRRKKIQTILLAIGIIIIIIYMSSKPFSVNWSIFFISLGILIGVIIGGGFKTGNDSRQVANNIALLSIIYIAISFMILYWSSSTGSNNGSNDGGNFIKDAVTVLIFSYLLGEIKNYRAKSQKIIILGPGRAGKTLFLAGCYMRVLDMAQEPANPSDDLLNLIDEMHKVGIEWPGQTMGVIKKYEFTYETGKFFPKDTILMTIDYPGPYIEKIIEYMDIGKNTKLNEEEKKYSIIAKEVIDSDRLIFVIDGEKYPNFGEMGIVYYLKIITKLHEKGKTFDPYVVITKSDVFMEEYGNDEDYDGFKEFIKNKISKNIYIKQLLTEAPNISFYPVFYYTKKVDNKYIPLRDENRNLYTFGFDKFMDHLADE